MCGLFVVGPHPCSNMFFFSASTSFPSSTKQQQQQHQILIPTELLTADESYSLDTPL